MTPDRVDELIALAALGELSPDEERELDAAARRDPLVAAEVDAALSAAAVLQQSHAEQPPVGLRSSVLAAISATPQDPPSVVDDVQDAPISLDERRGRRRFAPLVAAAAAVIVMIVGAAVIVSSGDDAGSDQVAAVVDASDASTSILTGELDLLVTFAASADAIVVEGDGLPALDDSETYQLWLVDADGATSVGVFRPDDDGTVTVRFDGVDPTGFVLGVTEEPAGGSASPTLPILASS